MAADDLEARLVDLEMRLAHHERMAEDLSDVIADQGRTIDRLTLQIRRLIERLLEVEAGGQGSPQDDKPPPHY
ncbi:SlyX family protein [Caenispirillum bisanense]|uniref:Protein SlyX homolog n=1 Tax=Caenispirillum bisanense TaxID=414052 RepID=A0A286H0B2_9PROT|nr:SlyX family protein [Caenispirillum bisanense]SOE00734.1 SlyX protein [Caenispirillum bisanense]